jgi:alginate O-acetyltransferase complex protein AlgI
MVFTSFDFLIFYALLLVAHALTPLRWRWATLLAASYFFYLNLNPLFVLLVAGVTLTTYVFTCLMAARTGRARRRLLQAGIAAIVLPLFLCKYAGAVNHAVLAFLQAHGLRWPLPELHLLLPLGISYYTFMALGYAIDVYNEDVALERHPGMLALFLAFFPLILSGPIERAGRMLPQFRQPRRADYAMIVRGLRLMLWGYFLKLAVADRIGLYVDAVVGNAAQHNGVTLLCAALLYPFQLYADLGGYTLLAIGAANLLGIAVTPNFRRPFLAASMSEFWRRWHMSLIAWIRDYLYTPLAFGLRRYRMVGTVAALLITFTASGLWHGASLPFLAWGLLQGVFVSLEALAGRRRAQQARRPAYTALATVMTFLLFAASEVVGRAATLREAGGIFLRIATVPGPLFIGKPSTFVFMLLGVAIVLLKDGLEEFAPGRYAPFGHGNKAVRAASYCAAALAIVLIGVVDGGQFIYFQF